MIVTLVLFTRLVSECTELTLLDFLNSLYSGEKAVGKEALKRNSDVITDIFNKEPEHPVGAIF